MFEAIFNYFSCFIEMNGKYNFLSSIEGFCKYYISKPLML